MKNEIFSMENITTTTSMNKNLHDFWLTLFQNELVSILSFSNSGKETLLNLFSGIMKVDYGKMFMSKNEICDEKDLQKEIFCITDSSKLVENLTIAENLFVISNNVKKKRFINTKQIAEKTQMILDSFLPNRKWNELVKYLSQTEQLVVTLIKAFVENCSIIVLDDILFSYSDVDKDLIILTILKIKKAGKSIIYFTHKIDLLTQNADRLIVLRRGRNIKTFYKDELVPVEIYNLASGIELPEAKRRENLLMSSVVSLSVKNLSTVANISNISFDLKKGEILGLYDIENVSNKEIINSIIGNIDLSAGQIFIDEKEYFPRSTEHASHSGIGFISRGLNRKDMLEQLSFSDNLYLPVMKKTCFAKYFVDYSILKYLEKEYISLVGILEKDKDRPLKDFDEATIQSVLLYRWILHKPKILACIEPSSNSDIFMQELIFQAFEELTAKGSSILISSADLTELSNFCDRILLLSCGKIVGDYKPFELEAILKKAISLYQDVH